MEPQPVKFGGCLRVARVQELAEGTLKKLPPRYIRPDLEQTTLVESEADPLFRIPVIDIQELLSDENMESELQKLHSACSQWGFFQIVNHGVNASLIEKMKAATEEFFKLPMEEKNKYEQQEGDMEGYGQTFVVSQEQKLEWSDMLYMLTRPVSIRKPHLLPKLPPNFREAIEAYSSELKILFKIVTRFMSKALKIEGKDFEDLPEEGTQSMRFNYYPPCPQPELALGLNQHSDPTVLAILLHVNDVEGLEIRKAGKWIPVKPMANAFVVNIGDTTEIISNGAYRSIEHRATVNTKRERLSIATFQLSRINGQIGPAPSLITPETPALFKTMGTRDFYREVLATKLEGKSYLEIMKIPSGLKE